MNEQISDVVFIQVPSLTTVTQPGSQTHPTNADTEFDPKGHTPRGQGVGGCPPSPRV